MDQTEKTEKERTKELDDNSESLNTMEQYSEENALPSKTLLLLLLLLLSCFSRV